jgi:hypothetical protein
MWKFYLAIFFNSIYIAIITLHPSITPLYLSAEHTTLIKILFQCLGCIFALLTFKVLIFTTYLKKAKAGDTNAQFITARNFYKGTGTKQSFKNAYYWICVAQSSKNNSPRVISNIISLKSKIQSMVNPSDISKIESRALNRPNPKKSYIK